MGQNTRGKERAGWHKEGGTGVMQILQAAFPAGRPPGKRRDRGWMAVMPFYLFTVFFVALAMVYMLVLRFVTRARARGVVYEFTLDNYPRNAKAGYLNTFKVSF